MIIKIRWNEKWKGFLLTTGADFSYFQYFKLTFMVNKSCLDGGTSGCKFTSIFRLLNWN